jgi:hypothetical protein
MKTLGGIAIVLAAYAAAAYAETPTEDVQAVLEQNKDTCAAGQDYVQLASLQFKTATRADYVVRAADISYAGVMNVEAAGDAIGAQLRGRKQGSFFCIQLPGATQ